MDNPKHRDECGGLGGFRVILFLLAWGMLAFGIGVLAHVLWHGL